jgi:hypothetical protein
MDKAEGSISERNLNEPFARGAISHLSAGDSDTRAIGVFRAGIIYGRKRDHALQAAIS